MEAAAETRPGIAVGGELLELFEHEAGIHPEPHPAISARGHGIDFVLVARGVGGEKGTEEAGSNVSNPPPPVPIQTLPSRSAQAQRMSRSDTSSVSPKVVNSP